MINQITTGKITSKPPLGRGIDALFQPSMDELDLEGNSCELPIGKLRPNPFQPRRTFDEEGLAELAASIRKQGIIQPLLVRHHEETGNYQIVAGERRFRAAKMVGLTKVPVFIRPYDDNQVMTAALIENLQREDLNPIEEARALEALRTATNLTQEQLAETLGKSRPAISNALRLLNLSEAAQEDLLKFRMSAGHARCLLGINDESRSEELRQRIVKYELTVREAEQAANYLRDNGCFPWDGEQNGDGNDIKPTTKTRTRRKKTPWITNLQLNVEDCLSVKATASGNEDSGRLTLVWTSQGELEQLLEKFGLEYPGPDPDGAKVGNQVASTDNIAADTGESE